MTARQRAQHRYREKHYARVIESQRRYRATHQATIKARYAANRVQILARQKLYNATHAEAIHARRIAYYAAHRDAAKLASRQWYQTHRDHVRARERQRRKIDVGYKIKRAQDATAYWERHKNRPEWRKRRNAQNKAYSARVVRALGASYIKQLLGGAGPLTDDLVEAKRLHIKVHRLILGRV